MEKFPNLAEPPYLGNDFSNDGNSLNPPSMAFNGVISNGLSSNGYPAGNTWSASGRSHNRQKSLGDAFRTIRARNGSMSQNAHEIADALRAPVSPKLVVCHTLPCV
jgi:solute carrier family 35 protein E1